ncbi:MAG: DUF4091 domain-containing protein [Phycisphaerae bacterium]
MSDRNRTFKKFNWSAMLVLVLWPALFCPSAYSDSFVVTNPPSTQKVLPTIGDAGPVADTLRIAMARGEYEPVQLVVHAGDKPLSGVRVSVRNLIGPNGSVLPQEQVTVSPIGYIKCKLSAPWPGSTKGRGDKIEIPDVLLPDRPMDIQKGRRQPYYITVRTLPTDQAGDYSGTVRISATGEKTREIPLLVRVYDIVLPVKSHLRTAFGMDTGYRKLKDAEPGQDIDTLLRYAKVLLAHRISPCIYGASSSRTKVPPIKRKDGTWDFSGTDRFLSELVPLGLTTFNMICGMYDEEHVRRVQTFAEHLKKRGWWNISYVYAFDEAGMDQLPRMQKWYGALVKAVPDVKVLQVGWGSPTKPLEGLVNIWCPLLELADRSSLQKARERGEEVWWYTVGGPKEPYPNVSTIDFQGIYSRIAGWMTYHYQLQGYLYYALDIWDTHPNQPTGVRLSVNEYDRANYANWDPDTCSADRTGKRPSNGLGWLLYPGKGNTPIPSMRLAMVRDGFEDYDLFKEVEMLAAGGGESAVRARAILDFTTPFDSPIIVSREKWTKVDNLLMQRRETILKIAEELRQPNNQYLKDLRDKQAKMDARIYPLPARE